MSKFRGSITLSIFSLSTLSNYHYWQSPKTRYWRLVRPYQTGIPPARLLALVWAHNPDLTKNQSTKNVPDNHPVRYVSQYEPHLTNNSEVLMLLPD